MKRKLSIILNALIVLFELYSLTLLFHNEGRVVIEYYTVESNILALISSTAFLIYLVRNEKINKFVKVLKYVSTVALVITFIVVIFVLLPMFDFNYQFLLLDGVMLYHHVLCPALAFISFVWFDDLGKYKKKDVYYPVIFTLLYGFVMIMLNFLLVVDGPYPFLRVYELGMLHSIIWFLLLIGICYLLSRVVLKFRKN